jgi:hypothetical protein
VAPTTLASEIASILLFTRAVLEVAVFTGLAVIPVVVIGYELTIKLKA